MGTYADSVEREQLEAQPAPPEAVFIDEEVSLSIKGDSWRVRDAKGALLRGSNPLTNPSRASAETDVHHLSGLENRARLAPHTCSLHAHDPRHGQGARRQ